MLSFTKHVIAIGMAKPLGHTLFLGMSRIDVISALIELLF